MSPNNGENVDAVAKAESIGRLRGLLIRVDNYKEFIDDIYKRLAEFGIDTSQLKLDHIAYQASSEKDYDKHVEEIKKIATQISETLVGGRKLGIFQLQSPLTYQDQSFWVVEIIAPREGQEAKSAWEHAEFLTPNTLEDFIIQYPTIEFDTSVMNRDVFPMLVLSLGDDLRAKFPRFGIIEAGKRLESKK